MKRGAKWTGVNISDELLIDTASPSKAKHIDSESETLGKYPASFLYQKKMCLEVFTVILSPGN